MVNLLGSHEWFGHDLTSHRVLLDLNQLLWPDPVGFLAETLVHEFAQAHPVRRLGDYVRIVVIAVLHQEELFLSRAGCIRVQFIAHRKRA